MDTHFLETFVLVAEHGSLAEAARRLGISPATAALRLRALEDELGARLTLRVGREVRPSEAGRAILDESRQLLSVLRRLRAMALADEPAGELRIGAISTSLTGILPGALRRLSERVPELEVFVLPGTSPEIYRALDEERVDAAVLVRPPFAIPKSFEWHVLRVEPMVLLCPADRAEAEAMELLRERPYIRYDRRNWGGRLADGWMKARRVAPRHWLELDQLEAIAVMVSNDLGVSIVPDWAPPWPEGLRVAKLPLPGDVPPREIGLLSRRGATTGRRVAALRDALRPMPGGLSVEVC